MKIKNPLVVILSLIAPVSFTMNKPENKIPVEIVNKSNKTVTVLFNVQEREEDTKYSHVHPNMSTMYSLRRLTPFLISPTTPLKIITSEGEFVIRVEDQGSKQQIISLDQRDTYQWKALQALTFPPLAPKTILTAEKDGYISLSFPPTEYHSPLPKKPDDDRPKSFPLPKRPDDDRPNVALSVYKKITGHDTYATPAQILGVNEFSSPAEVKTQWKKLLTKFHPNVNTDPDATQATQLLNWAYEQLKLK